MMDDDRPQAPPRLTAESHGAIAAIPAADWDRCAGGDNPLQSHAFLNALEASGAVRAETGWLPRHLTVRDSGGRIAGVMPFYAKSHSWGEYVFDHAWAHAWERAGGQYYPKGTSAIPFTPVPGARLMVDTSAPGTDTDSIRAALAAAAIGAGAALDLSSVHINFLAGHEKDFLETTQKQDGWITRMGIQYHWRNRGYESFDDFLGAMSSRKRKSIRRERKSLTDAGITMRRITGDAITAKHWDDFFRFYLATIEKKWGGAYLTRDFFAAIGAEKTLRDRTLLIMAEQNGETIAAALNFIGRDTLYGRNWGCARTIPFLHFETCYYQAIDYAIENNLGKVEAGAQGLHKVQRGYAPTPTWSAHFLYHAQFAEAIRDFTARERTALDHEMAELAAFTPYRKDTENNGDAP